MILCIFCLSKLFLIGRNTSDGFLKDSKIQPDIEVLIIFSSLTPVLLTEMEFDTLKTFAGVSLIVEWINVDKSSWYVQLHMFIW